MDNRKAWLRLKDKIIPKEELVNCMEEFDKIVVLKRELRNLKNPHVIKITPFIYIPFADYLNLVSICSKFEHRYSSVDAIAQSKGNATIKKSDVAQLVEIEKIHNMKFGIPKSIMSKIK